MWLAPKYLCDFTDDSKDQHDCPLGFGESYTKCRNRVSLLTGAQQTGLSVIILVSHPNSMVFGFLVDCFST